MPGAPHTDGHYSHTDSTLLTTTLIESRAYSGRPQPVAVDEEEEEDKEDEEEADKLFGAMLLVRMRDEDAWEKHGEELKEAQKKALARFKQTGAKLLVRGDAVVMPPAPQDEGEGEEEEDGKEDALL